MLAEKFNQYLRVEKQYSPHTLEAYTRDLLELDGFLTQSWNLSLFQKTDIAKIGHRMLRSWMADLLEAKRSHRTVARKVSVAKTYFGFVQQLGHATNNPAKRIKLPKVEKRLPAFLKEQETEALFNQVEFPDTFTGVRDKCILEILYGCGLRREELITLRSQDIDSYNRQLHIRGKGNKERVVPFGQHVAKVLAAYMEKAATLGLNFEDPFFVKKDGKPLYPKLVYRMVRKYIGWVSALNQRSPHTLRHTFATHLLDRGADLNAIKEMLGHASLASTQVYTHNSISKLKSVHMQAHPRALNHKDDSL